MKLYFVPGACSIGIHYLMERLGAPFERQRVNIRANENFEPWYVALNPKRKVPALVRDNGSALTEFPVIARYLAEQYPAAGLLPRDEETLLRASELTDFLVATVHMQGFTRVFRPIKFSPDEASHEAIKTRGLEIINDALQIVERQIAPGSALAGQSTFADAALFYVLFWAIERVKLPTPETCAATWRRMKASNEAARVFEAEQIQL